MLYLGGRRTTSQCACFVFNLSFLLVARTRLILSGLRTILCTVTLCQNYIEDLYGLFSHSHIINSSIISMEEYYTCTSRIRSTAEFSNDILAFGQEHHVEEKPIVVTCNEMNLHVIQYGDTKTDQELKLVTCRAVKYSTGFVL